MTPDIRHPTGESYPIETLRQMAAIPNNHGQRDQFIRELPSILQQVAEVYAVTDELIEQNISRIRSQLPWFLRWVPDKHIRRYLTRKAYEKPPAFVDDGKGQGTMTVSFTEGDKVVRRSSVTHPYPD